MAPVHEVTLKFSQELKYLLELKCVTTDRVKVKIKDGCMAHASLGHLTF